MTKKLTGRRPRAYTGVEAPTPPNMVYETFAPSTVDQALVRIGYFEFNIGDLWLKRDETDPTPYEVWMLVDKDVTTGTRLARWIKLYPGAGGAAVTTHRTDAGDAIPAANLLNVLGGTGINTAGAGNTVTINVNDDVAIEFEADDGLVATPTNNRLLLLGDTAGLDSLIITSVTPTDTIQFDLKQALDGQVPIGATGAPTRYATLTAGAGIAIVNGPNSITITNTGGGGGGGVNSVNPGDNINITGPATDPIVNLDKSVIQPATNAAGTEGVYALGTTNYITDRFLHNYGLENTFVGYQAGNMTLTGQSNFGGGFGSLELLTTGDNNTAVGLESLTVLQSGGGNTAIGTLALTTLQTGSDNIGIGFTAGANYAGVESDNIVIGHQGVLGDSAKIRIGTTGDQTNSFMAGIWQVTPAMTYEVQIVDSAGELGSFTGTDGQVIIGVTGGSPVWSTLTAGSGISIANAPGGITITNTGGGGGGGINSVTAGDNINLTGTAADPIVNLDKSVIQPATNAAGTEGVYALGVTDYITDRFLHNYGTENTFVGYQAGNMTLTGQSNFGGGFGSLELLTTGNNNTAVGLESLTVLQSGGENTAIGTLALTTLQTGMNNIGIGFTAGAIYNAAESDNIVIGHQGILGDSAKIRIGTTGEQTNSFMAGIWQVTPASTYEVQIIDSAGELGSFTGNDGEVIIGVTGGSPVWSTLTAGSGISITNNPGSITITNIGGGGGGGVNSVNAGDNINITGTAADPIVNLDKSVIQPATNAAGTEGVYALGTTNYITDRFLHNYGLENTFVGYQAGNMTLTGQSNFGGGFGSLELLTTGDNNTAVGLESLTVLQSGGENTAIGTLALTTLQTGSDNIGIGFTAGAVYNAAESNNIVIGHQGILGDSGKIRIGTTGDQTNSFMAGIWQVTPASTYEVQIVNSAGELGSFTGNTLQALMGVTGMSPRWLTITSSDGSISISQGATLDLTVVGGAVASVLPGDNINITGTAANPIVNLDKSVIQPTTNAAGTQGVYALGSTGYVTDRFLHNYGQDNTFVGYQAGNMTLTNAAFNVGVGTDALQSLTSGDRNVAVGLWSGKALTSGNSNTLVGELAGTGLTTGEDNVIIGQHAGKELDNSYRNVILGSEAVEFGDPLFTNSVVLGYQAAQTITGYSDANVIIGSQVATTVDSSFSNTVINSGVTTLTSATNNIYIGSDSGGSEDNHIRIGNFATTSAHVAGIYETNLTTNRRFVVVNSSDRLGYDELDIPVIENATFFYELDFFQIDVTGDGTEYYMGTQGGFGSGSAIMSNFYDTTGGAIYPGDGIATPFRFTPTLLGVYDITFHVTFSGITVTPPPPAPAPVDPIYIYLRDAGGSNIRIFRWIGVPLTYNDEYQTFCYNVQVPFFNPGDYAEFSVAIVQDGGAKTIDLEPRGYGANPYARTFIQGTYISPLS